MDEEKFKEVMEVLGVTPEQADTMSDKAKMDMLQQYEMLKANKSEDKHTSPKQAIGLTKPDRKSLEELAFLFARVPTEWIKKYYDQKGFDKICNVLKAIVKKKDLELLSILLKGLNKLLNNFVFI